MTEIERPNPENYRVKWRGTVRVVVACEWNIHSGRPGMPIVMAVLPRDSPVMPCFHAVLFSYYDAMGAIHPDAYTDPDVQSVVPMPPGCGVWTLEATWVQWTRDLMPGEDGPPIIEELMDDRTLWWRLPNRGELAAIVRFQEREHAAIVERMIARRRELDPDREWPEVHAPPLRPDETQIRAALGWSADKKRHMQLNIPGPGWWCGWKRVPVGVNVPVAHWLERAPGEDTHLVSDAWLPSSVVTS